jgi:hypothetical protein
MCGDNVSVFPFFALGVVLPHILPSIIATSRHHTQKDAILVLNILAGWTLFGWVAAFVWAFLDEKPTPSLESRLDNLEKLKASGKITEEEYSKLRSRELGL